jgi:hypothetical protein
MNLVQDDTDIPQRDLLYGSAISFKPDQIIIETLIPDTFAKMQRAQEARQFRQK